MALLSIPDDISMERLKALQQILLLREDAIPDVMEAMQDAQEFYTARDNYKPEPLPRPRKMKVTPIEDKDQ